MAQLRGHSRKTMALVALGGALAVILLGLALLYFVFFPTSSPKPFSLSATPGGATTTATSATSATASSTARSRTAGALSGSWRVASGSQAGYRVREKLAFLPAQSDAVGRTSQITGTAHFSETNGRLTITAGSFSVAVNTLTSDRSMRDEKIHEIGLESDRYPTATFVLSKPI